MQRHRQEISFPRSTCSASASLLSASAYLCHTHVSSPLVKRCHPQMEPCSGRQWRPENGGAFTPLLAIVHAVLGGVVVFDQTAALGGVRFIRDILLLLLLERQIGAVLWLLAISQRL